MRIIQISVLAIAVASLAACSQENEQAQGYSKPAGQTADSAAAPAAQQSVPSGNMPAGHPGGTAQSGPAPLLNKELHPGAGTVIKAMHAGGYTYMEVDIDGKATWIAATAMKVKSGEKVEWMDAAVMQNFASPSLHRTFEEILFVSNASLSQ